MGAGEKVPASLIPEPVASWAQTHPQGAAPSLGISLRADRANEEDGRGKGGSGPGRGGAVLDLV